jgi:hypothetical protein
MKDGLDRAHHYRQLADQFHSAAESEPDEGKRQQLQELADQYQSLVRQLLRSYKRPA